MFNRLFAAVSVAVAVLVGPALANVQPSAAAINIDGLTLMSRDVLAERFPELNSQEVDKLLFRIADTRSMAVLLAATRG